MLTQNLLYLATLFSLSAALPQAAGTTPSPAVTTASSSPEVTTRSATSALVTGCPASRPLPQSSSASAPLSSTSAAAPGSATSVPSGSAAATGSGSATSVSSAPTTSSTSVPVTSFELHPNGNTAKCLDVKGDIRANGTPVQIFDCNGTPAQQWVISPGEGPVVLAGTNFCLDAGTTPANGVGMKIWECFSNLAAQDWFYTDDKRIALTGKGFCLDLTEGLVANSNPVQTWHCTTNDLNQVWSTGSSTTPPPSTGAPVTSLPPTTTIPITIPPVSTPPPTGTPISFKLHPNGNAAKCLDVKGDILANGTSVQIFDCNGTPAQQWIIAPGEGHVVLAGTNFCLDAGTTPANGVGMKIWECFDNLAAQDWFYTDDKRIALTGKGFCLDLTEGLVANSNPVQTWHCTTNDVNQVWSMGN